jgi:hypothetical protein
MPLNLVRNSRLFFSSQVNSTTGEVSTVGGNFTTAHTANTTFEIQVLEGFSFSQNTNSEQVTVSEAGTTPQRGQRSFNTSLAPVDFSFSTYIRPGTSSTQVVCEEAVLWNALLGVNAINTDANSGNTIFTTVTAATYAEASGELTLTGTGFNATAGAKYLLMGIGGVTAANSRMVNGPCTVKTTVSGGTSLVLTMDNQSTAVSSTPTAISSLTAATATVKLYSSAWGVGASGSTGGFSAAAGHASNVNQLQKFGLLMIVDGVSYAIDNCALNEATIDFGLDGIATVQWTGQGTVLRQLTSNITTLTAGTFGGGASGLYTQKNVGVSPAPSFITNKLSTCKLKTSAALGGGSVGTGYYLALTGGSITISNNINYITPALLATVNQPATYYTGTRSVTGTLNAYLNTGTISSSLDSVNYTKGTGELLRDMLAAASSATEPMFAIELGIGGTTGTLPRVEFAMPSVSIGIPAINTEQVVSTAITFTAAPSTGAYSSRVYDLGQTNEVTLRYYSA